jgi:acyl-[acyl-carrier-protein]-phospholipid O-acyltransferase/long-chain-fatty-acid--[acyl-carrier-protein] ligase
LESFKSKNSIFYLLAAFLNAFVDLGHKITIQNIVFKSFSGSELLILTQITNAMMLIGFVILFVPAGEINDRRDKLKNMRILALAAIFLTSMLTLFYALGMFWAAFFTTVLLGAQAALYSPAKFGYAKSMYGKGRLSNANALLQTVSIVSILLSTVFFSFAFEYLAIGQNPDELSKAMLPISISLVVFSIIEFAALKQMELKEGVSEPSNVKKTEKYKAILKNVEISEAFAVLAVFYAISQSVMAAFPSFAKEGLGIGSPLAVQLAMASSIAGLIVGSLIAGKYKNDRHRLSFAFWGMGFYTFAIFWVLSGEVYLSFALLGLGSGFTIVSLNTLIQKLTPEPLLGSSISLSNLFQNILMLLFLGIGVLLGLAGVGGETILIGCAVLAFLVTVYYLFFRPHILIEAFLGVVFSLRYSFKYTKTPDFGDGGAILVGNHTSYVDWAFLQIAIDKKIHFLMEKEIYENRILNPFLRYFGAIPISPVSFKSSFKKAGEILRNGGIVVIFPEGELTKDGEIGEFRRGFEVLSTQNNVPVYPFYLGGLYGSRFSKKPDNTKRKRRIKLIFGEKLEHPNAASAKREVENLSKVTI